MKNRQIPYDFIKTHCQLNWTDAIWGHERHYIDWKDLTKLATDYLADGFDNDWLIELAGLDISPLEKRDAWLAVELAKKLAAKESSEDCKVVERKWLFLLLAWIFDNRTEVVDPLGEVELVYADFNYPYEIASFVRYMPVANGYDPKRHTLQKNEQRLYSLWEAYLDKAGSEIGCLKRN
jgi:hypothetical protein